jgi:hypothetical protein
MMYKHRIMWECCKKQTILVYSMHLLDKYNKDVQNARYIKNTFRSFRERVPFFYQRDGINYHWRTLTYAVLRRVN